MQTRRRLGPVYRATRVRCEIHQQGGHEASGSDGGHEGDGEESGDESHEGDDEESGDAGHAGDDEEIYNLIESSWLAILRGEKMPTDLTLLKDDDLQVWGNFDLQKEIKRFASKRTGFRFHEDDPSIALLLLQN